MIGVRVDDDVIRIPEPTIAESDIGSSDIPIPTVEPETAGSATGKMPGVGATEAAVKLPVRERMIHVVARVIFACVVTDPCFPVIHVRNAGMVSSDR